MEHVVTQATSSLQSMVFYTLGTFVLALFVLYCYTDLSRVVRLSGKLPGPRKVPIIGNALLTIGVKPDDILYKLLDYDRYGNVITASFGSKVVTFIAHPKDVEVILGSSVHLQKSEEYRYFEPWLGDGLLISKGEKWRTHRKIIAPTFHLNVLKTFVPLFYENSRDLVIRLRSQIGKEFDCHDYLSELTVNILMETAMGVSSKEKSSYNYAMAVMKMCDIIHRRQYNPILRGDFIFNLTNFAKQQKGFLNTIHTLTSRVIRSKKDESYKDLCSEIVDKERGIQENTTKETTKEAAKSNRMHYVRDDLDEIDENDVGEKKRLAFLDLMLELARQGVELTEKDIEEEVNTIMFEGHDTTAAGSSFVLCILGTHQDIQERVYEEINSIFKGSNRQCTFQDTLEMKYLERVIFETLRMFPPVPAIARKVNEDVKLVTRDDVIPKNSTVLIPIYKIHRLEEFYPNAEKFDPDNFLPEKMQSRHYYAFIPFSAGPRSCVGRKYALLKLKVLISTILRNYRILSDLTEKDYRLRVDIILKRSDGFRIKIEPRNKESTDVAA